MKLLSKIGLYALMLILMSTAINAKDPEDQLMASIKMSCKGLIDDKSNWLTKKLILSLPACQKIQKLETDDIEYGTTVSKYKSKLSQADLDRIYLKTTDYRKIPGKIELECIVQIIGEGSQVDSKCQKIRERLAKENVNMSLEDYRLLEKSCDYHHGCIDDYADKWAKGIRSFPPGTKIEVTGFELGDPTGGSENLNKTGTQATAISSNENSATSIDFTDIYADREQHSINLLKKGLLKNNETIASRCQCVFNQASCFNGEDYDYEQLDKALASADTQYESNKQKVCTTWYDKIRGRTSNNQATLNQLAANSKIITDNLDYLDQQFNKIQKTLRDKETEIILAAKKQQEAEDSSGFNLGKFAALSTGIILGGGLESLSSSELTNLVASAALDSMDGVDGVNNFNNSISNITEIRTDSLEQQNIIQSYSNEDKPTQGTNVTPDYFDALEPNSITSVSESNVTATEDSAFCTPSGNMSPSDTIFWDGSRLSCANGSSPVFGDGNWNYLSCPYSERKQAKLCQGESLRLAGLATCKFRKQKAARVSCECVYSGENHSSSYCSKKAQEYL